MNLINICKYCGARNYFSRKRCGYCGATLDKIDYWGSGKPGFDIIEFLRGLSTMKLLIGVIAVVVVIVVGIVLWQFIPRTVNAPPQIYGINVDSVTAKSVRVVWYTDKPSSSQVEYGRLITFGMIGPMYPQDDPTTGTSTGVTTHYVIIKPLSENTTYYFRVKSKDADGREAVSEGKTTFRTSETLPFNIPD